MLSAVRREKQHQIGYLLRRTWLTIGERNRAFCKLNGFFDLLNVPVFGVIIDLCINSARTYDVYANFVFSQLQRDQLRKGHLRCFGT